MSDPTPWLAHYDSGVPATLAPYPNRTVLHYIAELGRTRPGEPALLFKGASLSWSELDRQSDALATALVDLGVERSDRVGLLLPNCPQFVLAQIAAWKVGAIVAPLNPINTDHELESAITDHNVETIVTLTRFYQRVKQVQRRTPIRRIITSNIKEYFPPLLRLAFTVVRERRDGDHVETARADYQLKDLLRQYEGTTPGRAAPSLEDAAILLLSGGTTGTPKGALGRHAAYVLTGLQVEAWMKSAFDPGRNVIMVPLPLFHVYANVGIQGLAFVTGNPMALVPNPRDLDDLVATVRRVKPAFFNAVPTLYVALLRHPDVQKKRVDFKSIKICFSGAAALLADTKTRFEALTGGRIVEGYSLTEAMMALVVNPVKGPNKLGSVGMPLPDVHVRIVDADDATQEMPRGKTGEICLSAPQLMVGFWNRPEETSGVLRDHVEPSGTRRWLHTGDLGYLDEDGYLFIVDRKKDLIKTSGYQVWPREIEEILASHPSVAEVGVAGVPEEARGEAVRAWVVLRAAHRATEDELREFCRERLAPYKVPTRIEFRTDLPKSMVGKVLRRVLRESA